MKSPAKFRARHAAAAASLAVLALGASGCGAINDQATTMHYDASDGVSVWGPDVNVRNLMLVTNNAESPARFVGQVSNLSKKDETLTIQALGKTINFAVKAGSIINLEDEQYASAFTIPGSGDDKGEGKTSSPGLVLGTTISAGSEKDKAVNVPVVDGTIPDYAPFVPGGFDEKNAEHLKPSKAAEEGH